MQSLSALRRAVIVGTRIDVLDHWNPSLKPLRPRIVEKTQGNGYWFRHDGKRFWAEWPKASEITFNEDGSYTVRYGDKGTATFRVSG